MITHPTPLSIAAFDGHCSLWYEGSWWDVIAIGTDSGRPEATRVLVHLKTGRGGTLPVGFAAEPIVEPYENGTGKGVRIMDPNEEKKGNAFWMVMIQRACDLAPCFHARTQYQSEAEALAAAERWAADAEGAPVLLVMKCVSKSRRTAVVTERLSP